MSFTSNSFLKRFKLSHTFHISIKELKVTSGLSCGGQNPRWGTLSASRIVSGGTVSAGDNIRCDTCLARDESCDENLPWAAKQNFNQPEDAFTHKLNQFFIAHLFYHNKFLNKMLLSYSVWFPLRFLVLLNFHSCFYKYEKYRNFNIRSHVCKKLNKKARKRFY